MTYKYRIPRFQKILFGVLTAVISLSLITATCCLFFTAEASTPKEEHQVNPMNGETQMQPASGIRNPDSEVRGIWIASVENINFPSAKGLDAKTLQAELDSIVGNAVRSNLNAIYFQVRPTGDALYQSALFPVSAYLTGDQEAGLPDGFDPLAYLVELAHDFNIAVHAWVNPLRITQGSAQNPATDPEKLGSANPARLHPEWTVPYADGKLYYDAGLPEVRTLIAEGCAELAKNYNIDGIIFDDYFYPYPVKGATFDDADTYKQYGGGASLADWRRENVNAMVKGCYDAIKAVSGDCQFGIAPFGIWQNDDGSNGGSDTSGLSCYSALYADALAWIKGGYIDYIAPQIYWQFGTAAARFDELCRWWNAQCDGTGVDLLISHAAYRSAAWGSDSEIQEQVEFARSELCYRGSIHYGYAAICANDGNLQGQLESLYAREIVYTDIPSDGSAVTFTSPADGATVDSEQTYVLGSSDPGTPLYLNGKKLSRTKSGHFSLILTLQQGKNEFVFTQDGKETVYTLYRGSTSGQKSDTDLGGFVLASVSPSADYMIGAGETIALSVSAPSGSTVKATLGSQTVTLRQSTKPSGSGAYLAATYTGTLTAPSCDAKSVTDLGKIVFSASKKGESAEKTGANVSVIGASATRVIEVVREDSELKVAQNSWYYDDYTPAVTGMRDQALWMTNGMYKLRMGGFISCDSVRVLDGETVASAAKTADARIADEGGYTRFSVKCEENVPLNGYVEDGRFVLTLYNTANAAPAELGDNPLFSAVSTASGAKANSVRYYLTLKDIENFYGFSFSYENGCVTADFRNPSGLSDATDENGGALPLSGKTIALDAGHGGAETGAQGYLAGIREKDINLRVTLRLEELLTGLGAKVQLTRSDDSTVSIDQRLEILNEWEPDLEVSVHQNSLALSANITHVRGLLTLYFADSGRLLSRTVADCAADALNRYNRGANAQRLALVRNPKFPSTLVEVSFMTCAEEYELMCSDEGVERAAKGIAEGILEFYREQTRFMQEK